MEPEKSKQSGGVPPARPPPPGHPSAPPPEYPGGGCPPGPPGATTVPYGAPVPPGGPYYPPPPGSEGGYAPPPYPGAPGAPPRYPIPYGTPQQAYPGVYPGAPPPVYPGGLYPDISQLPQPQAVNIGYTPGGDGVPQGTLQGTTVPQGPPQGTTPTRPAPPPPPATAAAPQQNAATIPPLKEGEVPPGCVIAWKGGEGLKLYFYQQEGHIVSPQKPLVMTIYKKIGGNVPPGVVCEENLTGMIEVLGCWRLKLHGKSTYVIHATGDVLVFRDDSTVPSELCLAESTPDNRVVVLQLPVDMNKKMKTDLMTLLDELSDFREQEGFVDKVTTGVGTVYTDLTKKLNTAVKETVPGAHKSTKWIRKGTGSLVRMGGNLVSKGMHLIADQMPAGGEQQHEESAKHSELAEYLEKFRKKLEEGAITYV